MCLLQWKHTVVTTGPPGKSHDNLSNISGVIAHCGLNFHSFSFFSPIEFNKYILSACYTKDFVSDTWDTSEDKTTVPDFMELTV